jgi:hypothetical protein
MGASSFVTKERMGSEWLGRVLLKSEDFRGLINVLFAALIAADPKTTVDSRTGGDGVCLAKRDSVPEKQILPEVEPIVLAGDHPKIPTVLPHTSILRAVARAGRVFGGENGIKGSGRSVRITL